MKRDNKSQSSVLVAIDMGSHSFRAMAAEMSNDEALRILGVDRLPHYDRLFGAQQQSAL